MKKIDNQRNISIAVDRGGTFTDIYAEILGKETDNTEQIVKLLSEDTDNYPDAPTEGIRRALEKLTNKIYPKNVPICTDRIKQIRMGTTVATNALLERKGKKIALLTTKGFRDFLYIGNQTRPKIFDINIRKPQVLYDKVVEIDERVQLLTSVENNIDLDFNNVEINSNIQIGVTGEKIKILKKLDIEKTEHILKDIFNQGIHSLAIVFLHSYTYPNHEELVGKIAKRIGFLQISLSSDVSQRIKMVPRGFTTCADAYLTPVLKEYLASFCKGFDSNLSMVDLLFMQSDGGLTKLEYFTGHKAIFSGPAGGVVGYSLSTVSFLKNHETIQLELKGIIGFDMGGTSTDISRYDLKTNTFSHKYENTIDGISIQSPQLEIQTIAAGGGSRLFLKNNKFVVGPESAGATPGPISYGRDGGVLTITDANVLLGKILPEYFPKLHETDISSLDINKVKIEFEKLLEETNEIQRTKGGKLFKIIEEVAAGFIQVANEAMCRPIRQLTQMKGYDVSDHILSCFGGAGPQHACAIAEILGIRRIFISKYGGILSAYGMNLADVIKVKRTPCAYIYNEKNEKVIWNRLLELSKIMFLELNSEGFDNKNIYYYFLLNMRYQGTDNAQMITSNKIFIDEIDYEKDNFDFKGIFLKNYRNQYGFIIGNRDIIVDDIVIRGIGQSSPNLSNIDNYNAKFIEDEPLPLTKKNIYFNNSNNDDDIGSFYLTNVYNYNKIPKSQHLVGPCIIVQDITTIVVDPGWDAYFNNTKDIYLIKNENKRKKFENKIIKSDEHDLDPIKLSIFSHRFMGFAEEMGNILEKTSISVNMKERLDFSCALFTGCGGLVANAPHIPVHLGAMQTTIQYQIKYWKNNLYDGDVLVSNHPQLAGGSHLPDITVITPIFYNNNKEPLFFVASRGHHADIGSITPGSMPPFSKTLDDEGASIIAFKLVKNNQFLENEISDLLQMKHNPNVIGSRNIKDNISDLKAQIAANEKGKKLLLGLVQEYSLQMVQNYMKHIQDNAANAVADMLVNFSLERHLDEIGSLKAEDYMDDGTLIQLSITIDRTKKKATFDFNGTGPEVYGNTNAPISVTVSAIIYALRTLLIEEDIPLNEGVLRNVIIKIPGYKNDFKTDHDYIDLKNNTSTKEISCILNPSVNAAVVGGNVLTSQRLVDVIYKAFRISGASQGCMNNLTFGNYKVANKDNSRLNELHNSINYYETIGGGAGAGKSWHGCSAVHTNMTNTKITDPEILEKNFPVLLLKFKVRKDSGGHGMFHGGDGIIRQFQFLVPLIVSILSERRVYPPYGMEGGNPGKRGLNLLIRKDGRKINLVKKIQII